VDEHVLIALLRLHRSGTGKESSVHAYNFTHVDRSSRLQTNTVTFGNALYWPYVDMFGGHVTVYHDDVKKNDGKVLIVSKNINLLQLCLHSLRVILIRCFATNVFKPVI
jgi:hypothetical protein